MGLRTKSSSDYISNRRWLRTELKDEDVILWGTSALEYLELFVGYLYETRIDVYAREKGKFENVVYHVVDSFDGIDYVEIEGLKCSTLNQCANDMLEDWATTDVQALTEALSDYYYKNDKSFDGLEVHTNLEKFEEMKEWAKEY